ncbi:hypothetical protein CGMCC3_g6932 [Colletotrichum fructicola]|nr:uncharacterized protein CGMCC3_g6932 [Colletotrichum fructicola]KAE9577054.1 hypothetical protein CGMCC3_g6932 [Colletotrichum fructicola]
MSSRHYRQQQPHHGPLLVRIDHGEQPRDETIATTTVADVDYNYM